MTFEVRPDAEHPEIQNDGMKHDGMRFRAACKLAGKLYGQAFGVDVAFGDPILGEPEEVVAEDVLAFAGIAPPTLRIYPLETHIAEKLHAYTMPRSRPNSRVKDLPDLALLAMVRELDAGRVSRAIGQTFAYRATHRCRRRCRCRQRRGRRRMSQWRRRTRCRGSLSPTSRPRHAHSSIRSFAAGCRRRGARRSGRGDERR